ncbi:MAG TPA: hypothetical protein VHF50_06520 [Solirubrobacterales bacterium]|nr:hypothetical protein [Solirubrobacterales bacterium]
MRKRLGAAVAAALLLLAPAAPASTEAGSNCVADGSRANSTLLATPTAAFPDQPPVKEQGVLVNWTVRVGPGLGPLVQQFGVFRAAGGGGYTKAGEQTETLADGWNEFPARIPVQVGDLLGLYGPAATLTCGYGAAALFEGPVANGETKTFGSLEGVTPPVSAVVEPDGDDDGYGDQSQDDCPESADYHEQCPPLSYLRAKPRGEVIYVTLQPTSDSRIDVSCRVALPPDERGEARRTVRLSKPSRRVGADRVVKAKLHLPRAVRRRLRELPRKRALRAKVAVRTTDASGETSVRTKSVRLRGRGSRS